MVAVAGGIASQIHGMEAFEQRLGVLEIGFTQIPKDLIENWQNVREAIKDMNTQIQTIHTVIDDVDNKQRESTHGFKAEDEEMRSNIREIRRQLRKIK